MGNIEMVNSIILPIVTLFAYMGIIKQIQNDPKYAIFCLEKINRILPNLDILIQGFDCAGEFCPLLEHRSPHFSEKDSATKTSFAQRSNMFYQYGQDLMRLCREFTHTTFKKDLPKVYDIIEKIIIFLTKKESGQKDNLEIHCSRMQSHLMLSHTEQGGNKELGLKSLKDNDACIKFGKELYKLRSELNDTVKKQAPHLFFKL